MHIFRSKILVTSYIEYYSTTNLNVYDKLFAWLSNSAEIDWMVLDVKPPPKLHVGNLVSFKGIYMSYHRLRFTKVLI